MIVIVAALVIAALMPAVVFLRGAEWCLNRRQRGLRLLVLLALAALGAGTAYGLLRLTGVVILPNDNTHSVNFFDASWRDDGVRLLLICGAPFSGAAAALVLDWNRRRKGSASGSLPNSQIEEKS